ncbi:hypothetical protein BpHYR1_013838, partial [Brachionus plicatilis]
KYYPFYIPSIKNNKNYKILLEEIKYHRIKIEELVIKVNVHIFLTQSLFRSINSANCVNMK